MLNLPFQIKYRVIDAENPFADLNNHHASKNIVQMFSGDCITLTPSQLQKHYLKRAFFTSEEIIQIIYQLEFVFRSTKRDLTII